jgi:hypothetical protein
VPRDDADVSLLRAVAAVLRPLVRRLFAQGIRYGRVEARLRELFVEIAEEELRKVGQAPTASAVSLLAGINRKALRRMRSNEPTRGIRASASFHRNAAASLIGLWLADETTTDRQGRPIALPYQAGRGPSFESLARTVTSDVAPGSLLKDLVRSGAVRTTEDEHVVLLADSYGPTAGQPEKLEMLAEDPVELLDTMLHNIFAAGDERLLQRKVFFDNIGSHGAAAARRDMRRAGERFLKEVARRLAKYDRDRNPRAPSGERRYAGVGVYYFESPMQPASEAVSEPSPVRKPRKRNAGKESGQ